MEQVEYAELYRLQDRVLETVFRGETSFYLTGGTCLHRFYHGLRHSDDLDFFTNEVNLFREDSRILRGRLESSDIVYKLVVDSRDFIRLLADGSLKIDLVNDRVYRSGGSRILDNGIRLDNIGNILANKLCAVLGRDEPKDVFDICVIAVRETVDWQSVMEDCGRKCDFDREALAYRLSSFPLELFDLLPCTDKNFLAKLKTDYRSIIGGILRGIL